MADFEGVPATTGGCGCGAVRWELSEPALRADYCHCTRCQRRTGTAYSACGLIVPGSFRVTQGEELIRAWRPDDGWEKHFCGECGSALFSRDPEHPEQVRPRLGGFDGDPGVRPEDRQFVAYAVPWEPIPDDGLPHYPERRPPRS
jgi:hypothetical protein